MTNASDLQAHALTGATPHARMLVAALGVALCIWVMTKIRNRRLMIPIGTLLLAGGVALMAFSAFPQPFDRLASFFGVYYPPVFYLVLSNVALTLLLLHFGLRLSVVDERCRKLAQNLTLLEASLRPEDGAPGKK